MHSLLGPKLGPFLEPKKCVKNEVAQLEAVEVNSEMALIKRWSLNELSL